MTRRILAAALVVLLVLALLPACKRELQCTGGGRACGWEPTPAGSPASR